MNSSHFHTTHWTAVLAAKESDTQGRAALAELCVRYREPIRRFIVRNITGDESRRYGGRDAEDLTQDFLAEVLAGQMFESLQRHQGKFRSYLLGAVSHFLSVVRKREQASKRGGGMRLISLPNEPGIFVTETLRDAVFDRDWALATIDRALEKLEVNSETQALLPWLSKELTSEDRANLAHSLGMSDTAIKVAVHRLRKRYRRIVREIIAQSVSCESEIESELAYLLAALK